MAEVRALCRPFNSFSRRNEKNISIHRFHAQTFIYVSWSTNNQEVDPQKPAPQSHLIITEMLSRSLGQGLQMQTGWEAAHCNNNKHINTLSVYLFVILSHGIIHSQWPREEEMRQIRLRKMLNRLILRKTDRIKNISKHFFVISIFYIDIIGATGRIMHMVHIFSHKKQKKHYYFQHPNNKKCRKVVGTQSLGWKDLQHMWFKAMKWSARSE